MACDRCGELERRLAAVERVAVESIDEMAGEGYTGWAAGARTRLDAALAGGSEAPAAPAESHKGHNVLVSVWPWPEFQRCDHPDCDVCGAAAPEADQ